MSGYGTFLVHTGDGGGDKHPGVYTGTITGHVHELRTMTDTATGQILIGTGEIGIRNMEVFASL